MSRRRSTVGGPLAWVLLFAVVAVFAFATIQFGWPKSVGQAGSFAEFVGALLSPISLMLLVLSLNTQARAERRVADDNFVSLQVQTLIALAEDDRYKLRSMADDGEKDTQPFHAIVKRYKKRVRMLNNLLKSELLLPAEINEDDSHLNVN